MKIQFSCLFFWFGGVLSPYYLKNKLPFFFFFRERSERKF
jgi:hypothetical protein